MSLARVTPVLLTLALAGCGAEPVKQVSPPRTITQATAKPKDVVAIPAGPGHLAAMAARRGFTLRASPGGRVVAHLRPRTEWGSPTIVWAAERRGRWLGVVATAIGNNRIAWLDARRDHPRMWRSQYSLHVDLSQRSLELWRGSRAVKRMRVGIGGPSTPTPTGRFSVTDEMPGSRYSAFYGCCIVALSGHQVHTPAGWQGGNRLAIHGTSDPGSIGVPSSAGCLHADADDLRLLMRRVPLGAPVFIRA